MGVDSDPSTPAEQRIGRFRAEAVIGTGGFATVYRAVDDRLEDVVAVKVLAENHSLSPHMRERFITEGRVLRRVNSSHVVRIHDLGEDARRPFLVLEYADRGTLEQRRDELRARGWWPTSADLLSVAQPVAYALEALHRLNVVHRDLSPGNILLTTRDGPDHLRVVSAPPASAVVRADERVLVTDLGLCKDLGRHSGLTVAVGTDGFRPPELRGGPAQVGLTADLWSLSALVVWLITGAAPGEGSVWDAVTAAGLPSALGAVLVTSLAVDPSARHRDPASWLAAVDAALTTGVAPPRSVAPALPPPPRGRGHQPTPLALARPARHLQRTDPPLPAAADVSSLGWAWRLDHSLWLLPNLLCCGLGAWAGFLYVGVRAKRRRWLWASAGYGGAALAFMVLASVTPRDATGELVSRSWQSTTTTVLLAVTWLAGLVHGVIANLAWLRYMASEQSPPRP